MSTTLKTVPHDQHHDAICHVATTATTIAVSEVESESDGTTRQRRSTLDTTTAVRCQRSQSPPAQASPPPPPLRRRRGHGVTDAFSVVAVVRCLMLVATLWICCSWGVMIPPPIQRNVGFGRVQAFSLQLSLPSSILRCYSSCTDDPYCTNTVSAGWYATIRTNRQQQQERRRRSSTCLGAATTRTTVTTAVNSTSSSSSSRTGEGSTKGNRHSKATGSQNNRRSKSTDANDPVPNTTANTVLSSSLSTSLRPTVPVQDQSRRRVNNTSRSNFSSRTTPTYRGGSSIRTLIEETRQNRQGVREAGGGNVSFVPPLTQAYCDYLLAECVSHDEWSLVPVVLSLMNESQRPQVHSTYTACLSACFQTANAATARHMLSTMMAAGITPLTSDYALAIGAICRRDQQVSVADFAAGGGAVSPKRPGWRTALALLNDFTESKPQNAMSDDLPLEVYDAILTCMVPDRQWKEAMRLLRRMEHAPAETTATATVQTRPALSTYRTVIECCVAANEAEQAVQVLQSCVHTAGLTPTLYAFELVIGALTKKLQWRRARQLLDVMEELRVPRTLQLYNFVLTACAKAREPVQAKQLLQRMRRRDNIAPNIVSFNSVLSACASTSQWRDALAVLDLVQREPGVTPDIYTYTNAIRACAKGGKTERALSLFQVVKDKGLPLDSYCYTAVIEACDWKQGLQLLREMEERGIEASEVAYSVTIKACGDSGQWQTALDLVDTMRNKTIPVNLYVYNAAITAVSKAAKQRSKERHVESNLYTNVLALLDQMRLDGIEPDGFSFSSAISCCGSEGRWEEALDLIDVMLKGGPKTRPNKIAYTAAISSCGRAGKVEHALRLFRQMKEQGLSADRVAYNALFSALRVSRKSEAACELWDEMLGKPSIEGASSRVAMARSLTSPDIITLTDAIGAMCSGSDRPAIRERIDRVFADAVRLGAVFRDDRQISLVQYDLTSMTFPVARAACRFVLQGMKMRNNEVPVGRIADLLFITGAGNQRQNGAMSLRAYVQEVLRSDFNPSIDSTVSNTTQGSLTITAKTLSLWMKS